LNETTAAKEALLAFNLDAVGDGRALNETLDVISIGRAADAARLQAAADNYLSGGERPAMTLVKRGEIMPWSAASSSLYKVSERATMAAVATGLIPSRCLRARTSSSRSS
jgi:hypothetical protein